MKKFNFSAAFKNLANDIGELSSSAVEQLIKSVGLVASRKQINKLAKAKIIKPPAFEPGTKVNGDRHYYDEQSFKDLLVYLLAEQVCGLHGANSREKNKIFRFAKESLDEFKGDDIKTYANFKALSAAGYLVPSSVKGAKRLQELKKMVSSLMLAIVAMWLARSVINYDSCDFSVSEAWVNVKDVLFNKHAIRKFSQELVVLETAAEDSGIITSSKDDVVSNLSPEAIKDLLAWTEILMIFRSGIMIVKKDAEQYMLKKHKLNIMLDARAFQLFCLQRSLS